MKSITFRKHSDMVRFFRTNKFKNIFFLVASLPEHKFRVEQKEILEECNFYSSMGQYENEIEGNVDKINISFEYDIGGDCIELHR